MKRFVLLMVLGLMTILSFVSYPGEAYAKKSFWEAMLGPWLRDIDNGPKPEETLQAPFADDPYKVNKRDLMKAHALVPVTQAHVDTDEVGKWLMTAAAEALTYKVNETEEELAIRKAFFTDKAWEQTLEFKEAMGFNKVMQTEKFNVHSFVQNPPLLLNAVEHNGRFRWLFEVPLMMSAIGSNDFNYHENDAANKEVVVIVQVGRYTVEEAPEGMLIETFRGRDQAMATQQQ